MFYFILELSSSVVQKRKERRQKTVLLECAHGSVEWIVELTEFFWNGTGFTSDIISASCCLIKIAEDYGEVVQ